MQSNFFTSNSNISEIAIELAEIQKFKELLPTADYINCDFIQINGTTKQFWFTTQNDINKSVNLINSINGTLTQKINLKEIKKWQTK